MRKLKLIMAALALVLGWSNASANQTLADNGVYYIQNVETGLFLSRGGWAGAHAIVDNYGLAWRLSGTNGSIKLQMYDIYCEGFTTGGLGGDSFVDNGSPLSNWTLTGDANGYTIKTGDTYLTASGNTPGSDAVINGDGSGNITWVLLSDAEHAAVLAAKTSAQESAIATTAGIDLGSSTLSAILGNTSNWRTSNIPVAAPTSSGVWTYTENRDQSGANNYGDYGTELFNKSGKFTKTISGLENGIYKLTVKAMHRSTYPAPTWTAGESFANHTNSYVLANGYYAQLKDWKSAAENTSGYNPDNTDQFKAKVDAGNYATDIYTYVSNRTLDITVSQEGFWHGEWFAFNGVTLTYYTDQVTDDDATAILATATSLEAQEMDADILSALSSAKSTFNGARTIANYNALQTAIDNAQASADAYALFAPERTKALALGMTAEAIAALAPDVHALMVAEYNYVTTNYAYGVSLGTWTTTNALERSGQHWDNTSTSTYSEQNEGWGSASWSCSYSQNLTLPAGSYVFKVAGRKSSDAATITLEVKNGNTTLGTVNDFPNGDTGLGINTSGATDFTTGEGHTYANNGVGRGWQWRYVKFDLNEPATVNVAVNASANALYQWVGFCNATVQTNHADNVALMEALVALNSAKTAATLTKNTTNVGTGVFQLNETTNNTSWSAYETAKGNAENYSLTASSTASEVNGITTALTTAISNYQNQTLNAPDAEKRYNVSIVEAGKAWDGNAVTFIAGGRGNMGNYGVKYLASANANLNQALKFTAVAGEANTYKVSAIRVENGSEQYLTTGSTYDGGNNDQIRTTDDASKAMWIKIEPTSTDNQFQLRNMSANKIIANNNNDDMYTAYSANFTIAEASQASVAINIDYDVKYATRIFPFTPLLPSGVKAYSCGASVGDVLTLVEVAKPAANVPYILEATSGYTGDALTGWGTAGATSYTEGWLTGVYTNTYAPNGSYVLQNNDDRVAFYLVDTSKATPEVGANRCYLTVSAGARPAFFFDNDETTGINALNALTTGKATIYDVNGRQVPSLQKGMNIVKANGKSYKVVVK